MFVYLLPINSAPLRSTSHVIHILNHQDSGSALVCQFVRILTVCWEVSHWRKLRSEESEVTSVDVHQ